MSYSEDNIQKFFDDLMESTKERHESFLKLGKTTKELLKIEVKSKKADKEKQKEKDKHKKFLKQQEARKEKDQKGPLQQMFSKDKDSESKLSGWLLAALGIAGTGLAAGWLLSDDPNAKKIREAIGDAVKEGAELLTGAISDAIDQAVDDLKASLQKWADDQARGTGLGGSTTPGQQEVATEEAEGTLEEKKQQLREEIKSGNWLDNITGAQQERKEQLYYLESGEVMSYEPGFRRGGGGGAKGHGIVSGDVTRVRDHNTGLSEDDKADLDELDDLIRTRISFNDDLAAGNITDEERENLEEALAAAERTIGRFYDKNKELTEVLKEERNARLERVNNPVQKKQTGGIINVPGYGDGDKVPMLLPPESFVLNKKASKHFQKRQKGGTVEAVKHIKKDEALSSLTRGSNDWIRPGGNSVRSKTPWSNIKPNTPIHAYTDSVGVPTIGWGSTYYDDISSGKQKVKLGDTITKGKADKIMLDNVAKLARKYAKKIPNWKKMSDTQRAGLLYMGYNAPNFYGAYKNVTAALDSGNMAAVRKHLKWGGPSATRVRESQEMMTKGPQNLNAIVGPKIVGPKKVGTGNVIVDTWNKWTGKQEGGSVSGPTRQGGNAAMAPTGSVSVPTGKGGGPITVPGSGSGDKVPMLLPAGSFVLNREASQKLQTGGIVGAETIHQRFMEVNSSAPSMIVPAPRTVIVKRRSLAKVPQASDPNAGYNMGSGSGVNIVEQSSQLHRIQSGAAV